MRDYPVWKNQSREQKDQAKAHDNMYFEDDMEHIAILRTVKDTCQ